MDITIQPNKLHGNISIIPSKSQAHRMLICAAFADKPTTLVCPETNQDIEATARCLNALGAFITRTACGYQITPVEKVASTAVLPCDESGSTLRFLLPIVGALGVDATFQMSGRLPQRPLSPLWEEMERMGCSLARPTETTLHCQGKLHPGSYEIDGGVSSQFITGLLFAMSLMNGARQLTVTGKIESKPYIDMTMKAMELFGVALNGFDFQDDICFHSPGEVYVEGDWSNGAFFLAANTLGSDVTISNLNPDSPQGDKAVVQWLSRLDKHCTISVENIPDLVPILAVVAGAKDGAVFTNIQRLRMKESDRVQSVIDMLTALGGKAEATEDTLTVYGTGYQGGIVNACNDHRIAMAAGIAATVCKAPVTILGAEAVKKSYPLFWNEYRRLGGQI